MKNSTSSLILLFFNCLICFAQHDNGTSCEVPAIGNEVSGTSLTSSIQTRDFNSIYNTGKNSTSDYNSSNGASSLLFESWVNVAYIYTNDGISKLDNVNFDVINSTFVTKTNDGRFINFNIQGDIKKIIINNKSFIKEYVSSENGFRIYEVLHKDSSYSILKEYGVTVYQQNNDPFKRNKDNISITSSYYKKDSNGVLTDFNLNKKSLLQLCDTDNITNLKQFMKENKLSYRKEKDVSKLLNHSNELAESSIPKSSSRVKTRASF